jgi:N-acetylmuramoyl-L-alanine amidase
VTKTSSLLTHVLCCMCSFLSCLTICEGGECIKSGFVVAIDVGHTRENGGATSATGIPEYVFNRILADSLFRELKKDGYIKSFLIGDNSLRGRVAAVNKRKANLLLSIHHDSVQPQYLLKWIHEGRTGLYSDKYRGFSIFYSEQNQDAKRSLLFAEHLGLEMLKEGLTPTLHHAEKIAGENRELVDKKNGVYRYDGLGILKGSTMPAVLLECGIILNRREEELLNDPIYRMKIVSAIVRAINQFCSQ